MEFRLKKIIIIGISGPSASGKTLFSRNILSNMNFKRIFVISEDSYYRKQNDISMKLRNKANYDHPSAFDHSLLFEDLKKIKQGKKIFIPTYDYIKHMRSNFKKKIGYIDILILEGILIFVNKKIRELLDIKIYMDTPLDICLARRLIRDIKDRGRNMNFVINQYQKTVRPMYVEYVEPVKKHVDIIISCGGNNKTVVDLIIFKIKNALKNKCE